MKHFKSLLIAPAALGFLSTFSVSANEVNLNEISNYSDIESFEFANSFSNDDSNNQTLLAGGEGLVDDHSHDGGFSETTTASFSVDAAIGAIDGDTTSEATTVDYQFNIGLSTSFTGEDSLDVAIDSGSTATTADNPMAFDTGSGLTVDGVTYSFPLGGLSMVVGVDTDVSTTFTGACSYSAFTDYMGDCGTGNSIGSGGNGFTVAGSYAFDSGFSLAGSVSGTADAGSTAANAKGLLTKEGSDSYGIEAAYTADSWGVSVAYVYDDNNTSAETTTWGVNGTYSFDLADVSVGFETEETSGTEKSGYFVGVTFPEVGPGSVSVGAATSANYASSATEYMIYEAAYSYPVNDGLTITPGVFIEEKSGDDLTGVIVKSSFSF